MLISFFPKNDYHFEKMDFFQLSNLWVAYRQLGVMYRTTSQWTAKCAGCRWVHWRISIRKIFHTHEWTADLYHCTHWY